MNTLSLRNTWFLNDQHIYSQHISTTKDILFTSFLISICTKYLFHITTNIVRLSSNIWDTINIFNIHHKYLLSNIYEKTLNIHTPSHRIDEYIRSFVSYSKTVILSLTIQYKIPIPSLHSPIVSIYISRDKNDEYFIKNQHYRSISQWTKLLQLQEQLRGRPFVYIYVLCDDIKMIDILKRWSSGDNKIDNPEDMDAANYFHNKIILHTSYGGYHTLNTYIYYESFLSSILFIFQHSSFVILDSIHNDISLFINYLMCSSIKQNTCDYIKFIDQI
jgi:hypothetical protein